MLRPHVFSGYNRKQLMEVTGTPNNKLKEVSFQFFPVLLVTHWLTCGGAEEKAESIKKRQQVGYGTTMIGYGDYEVS